MLFNILGKKRPLLDTATVVDSENASSHKKSSSLTTQPPPPLSTLSDELTLEQRLEALSSQMNQLEAMELQSHSQSQLQYSDSRSNVSGGTVVVVAPTSDSLVTLIDQALQSGK